MRRKSKHIRKLILLMFFFALALNTFNNSLFAEEVTTLNKESAVSVADE